MRKSAVQGVVSLQKPALDKASSSPWFGEVQASILKQQLDETSTVMPVTASQPEQNSKVSQSLFAEALAIHHLLSVVGYYILQL